MACLKAYDEGAPIENLSIAHKVSGGGDGYPADCPGITRTTTNDDSELALSNVVGGTAFFFARRQQIQAFDWLFVAEAGQVSLANLVAMGRCARNIVLGGAPRQLPQVIGSEERRAGTDWVGPCRHWRTTEPSKKKSKKKEDI